MNGGEGGTTLRPGHRAGRGTQRLPATVVRLVGQRVTAPGLRVTVTRDSHREAGCYCPIDGRCMKVDTRSPERVDLFGTSKPRGQGTGHWAPPDARELDIVSGSGSPAMVAGWFAWWYLRPTSRFPRQSFFGCPGGPRQGLDQGSQSALSPQHDHPPGRGGPPPGPGRLPRGPRTRPASSPPRRARASAAPPSRWRPRPPRDSRPCAAARAASGRRSVRRSAPNLGPPQRSASAPGIRKRSLRAIQSG
ncbi:hypothetical protein SAMN05444365_1081 [Micromonospora pattaloongensis]|uniref:Uncharacterized protein n=1 Tax=Micromonospora pattaloongensis TaxID=405436 RepID=A0A1H3RGB0_9ACTN|nr:hypothetical protein SAMN05444365_1081 [Micromonospora pattaloongensis]